MKQNKCVRNYKVKDQRWVMTSIQVITISKSSCDTHQHFVDYEMVGLAIAIRTN